jgi:hypothetical protein
MADGANFPDELIDGPVGLARVGFATGAARRRRAGVLGTPADLIGAARRRTGLPGTIGPGVEAALTVLLDSLREEANLSLFGTLATRHDLVSKLSNLLILDDLERADPTIAARPVMAPVFITGLPRSGTSFLHAVLAEHQGLLAPRAWQTVFPAPGHRAAGRHAGPDRFARQLAIFHRLSPELAALHPITAWSPQECTEMSAHVFRSLRFDSTHRVPSYRAWLDRTGLDEAYRFERRFLQHLQGAAGGRWVLKSPDHVFALPSLRLAFADARLVMVHRDPLRVIASVARLTELLRRPFARAPDRREIGRQVLRDWLGGMERIMEIGDGEVVHVRHRALVGDPVGTVEGVCRALGIAVDAASRARMAGYVEARPRGGYGRNRYDLADFGIEPGELEPMRSRYLRRFGLAGDGAADGAAVRR